MVALREERACHLIAVAAVEVGATTLDDEANAIRPLCAAVDLVEVHRAAGRREAERQSENVVQAARINAKRALVLRAPNAVGRLCSGREVTIGVRLIGQIEL